MREHAAFNVLNQVHSMKCAFILSLLIYCCVCVKNSAYVDQVGTFLNTASNDCVRHAHACIVILIDFCFRWKFVAMHQQHLTHNIYIANYIEFHFIQYSIRAERVLAHEERQNKQNRKLHDRATASN